MELNWSTFVLELVNLLVLVLILQRFLYRPVLEVIERRRASVEKTIADATAVHAAAEVAKASYEGRLDEWARERERQQAALTQELEELRKAKLAALATELDAERAKREAVEKRRLAQITHEAERTAAVQGARFAQRLLEQVSDEALHGKLVSLFLSAIAELPSERLATLSQSGGKVDSVIVATAFPLSADQRAGVAQALRRLVPDGVRIDFADDRALIAGLRVTLGANLLGVNVADELAGFAALSQA